MGAFIGLQDRIERELLLSASAGMCGDESQVAGRPAGEQVAYFFDVQRQILIKLGENVGIAAGREGRYFLYCDFTQLLADCVGVFPQPPRDHRDDPGGPQGINGDAYPGGFGRVNSHIVQSTQ